jgi:hypothetical protein
VLGLVGGVSCPASESDSEFAGPAHIRIAEGALSDRITIWG